MTKVACSLGDIAVGTIARINIIDIEVLKIVKRNKKSGRIINLFCRIFY